MRVVPISNCKLNPPRHFLCSSMPWKGTLYVRQDFFQLCQIYQYSDNIVKEVFNDLSQQRRFGGY